MDNKRYKKIYTKRDKLYKKSRKKIKNLKENTITNIKNKEIRLLFDVDLVRIHTIKCFFTENANNAKKTWIGIKLLINIRSAIKNQPSSLMVNNEITSDLKVVAAIFNNYFSSIGNELKGKMFHKLHDFTK